MILFCVAEDLDLTAEYAAKDGDNLRVVRPRRPGEASVPPPVVRDFEPGAGTATWAFTLRRPEDGRLTAERLYVGTAFETKELARVLTAAGRREALRVLTPEAQAAILARPGLPPRLGWTRVSGLPWAPLEAQWAGLAPGRPVRVAVLNSFVFPFGDAILAVTLLRELHRRLAARFGRAEIELVQTHFSAHTQFLFRRSGVVSAIRELPLSLAELAGYDAYLDFTDELVRGDLPWIDACLEAASIDPATVPPARKRNRHALDPACVAAAAPVVARARAQGRPLLMLHPLASTPSRSVPAARVPDLARALIERTEYHVVSPIRAGVRHPRFTDWSEHSPTFEHFMALVAGCDAFVSVDTAMYHAADCFDVPGVVLFTLQPPAHRVGYYPFIDGHPLGGDDHPLLGLHFTDDPAALATIDGWWAALDVDAVVRRLAGAVARRAAAAPRATA